MQVKRNRMPILLKTVEMFANLNGFVCKLVNVFKHLIRESNNLTSYKTFYIKVDKYMYKKL